MNQTRYQSTEILNQMVTGILRRSPNCRLVTLFRTIRNNEHVSRIGDYPLFSYLAHMLAKLRKKELSRFECLTVLKESEEFSDMNKKSKTEIVDEILRVYYQQRK